MPVVSMNEILKPAFKERYGVPAFNIVNDLTMAAVLEAAAQMHSPVIVQVSVEDGKMFGAKLIQCMFEEMASHVADSGDPTSGSLSGRTDDKDLPRRRLEFGAV